jgi:VanZ family protein
VANSPFHFRAGAWLYWLGPPLLLMAFIFWLGSDTGSSAHSEGVLERLFHQLAPGLAAWLDAGRVEAVNHYMRKLGHFSGYALLGLLDARAWRGLRGTLSGRAALAAWAAAICWAGVDEFHQSFFPSRGASVWDVALDGSGAAVAVLLYLLWTRCPTPKS